MEPLIVSWGWQSETLGPSGFIDLHEWQGTRDLSAFLAVPAAIKFQNEHDWVRIWNECHVLAEDAEVRIRALTGQPSLYASEAWFAQMVAIRLPAGTDSVALKDFLYGNYRLEIPLIEWNGDILLRVSVQGYNSKEELDTLVLALRDWLNGQ